MLAQAGRNQIYTAASYRSEPPRILRTQSAPLPPAAQLRFASVIQHSRVGRLTFSSPISAPSSTAGVASFASRVSFLPPRCPPGQSASQAAPCPPSGPKFVSSPLRGPHTSCSAAAWLLRLLGCSAPVPSRWPIVSPPPLAPMCYRGHSHPGSDKHACPPREPTAVGQACFMFAGVAPRGWRMSPSCFAGPAAHPRHDIIDPDTRCLFRASMPPRRPTSALNCFRACAGHTANSYCAVSPSVRDPFRGRIATQTSCLLLLTIIVIRPIPQLFPSPVRRRMLRRASKHVHHPSRGSDRAHVTALVETSHLAPRGLFRRCYCSGATVFGHDHRP